MTLNVNSWAALWMGVWLSQWLTTNLKCLFLYKLKLRSEESNKLFVFFWGNFDRKLSRTQISVRVDVDINLDGGL